MKTWICPQCGEKTNKDKQFCEHCLFNVTRFYVGSGPAIRTGIPWDYTVDPRDNRKDQEKTTELIVAEKKKWTQTSAKYRNWEKGRKKRLFERRDYFRAHPEKHDDFSGV